MRCATMKTHNKRTWQRWLLRHTMAPVPLRDGALLPPTGHETLNKTPGMNRFKSVFVGHFNTDSSQFIFTFCGY